MFTSPPHDGFTVRSPPPTTPLARVFTCSPERLDSVEAVLPVHLEYHPSLGQCPCYKYITPSAEARGHSKGDIATFTALAFHTCNNIGYGLICATTDLPLKKVHLTGEKTGFRLFSDLSELDDHDFPGWKRLRSALGETPKPPKRSTAKPHQKPAIRNAFKHFVTDKETRRKMIMPCGTGKSLTGFWIAQKLGAKRTVVAVPSLALVKQTLNVWTREYLAHGIRPDWICVFPESPDQRVDSI